MYLNFLEWPCKQTISGIFNREHGVKTLSHINFIAIEAYLKELEHGQIYRGTKIINPSQHCWNESKSKKCNVYQFRMAKKVKTTCIFHYKF